MPKMQDLKEARKLTPKILHDIVLKRRLERKWKADEKRLHDLRRMDEMKSKLGIHPVRDLFPTKDPALSPQDRYNLRRVHPIFEEITETTKIQDIILPLVLNYVLDYMVTFLRRYHLFEEYEEDLLVGRRVSKSIRRSNDKWIEDDLVKSMKKLDKPRFDPFGIYLYKPNVKVVDVIKKRVYTKELITIGPTRKQVFLNSLQLSIEIPSSSTDNGNNASSSSTVYAEYKEKIFKFLVEKGNRILYLDLSITEMQEMPDYGVSIPEIYSTVRELLQLTPNLKWLTICTDGDARKSFQGQPMPKLSSLERVDMYVTGLTNYPLDPIVDAVLFANPHVKYINVKDIGSSNYSFNHTEKINYYTSLYTHPTFSNLALETVEFKFYDWDWHSVCDKIIANTSWNLRKLALWIDSVSLQELFDCIQRNFPNLEYLKLRVFYVTIGAELKFLRLPNLKCFKLYFGVDGITFTGDFHFFFSLHFLLYSVKLERITWYNQIGENILKKFERQFMDGNKTLQSQRSIKFKGEREARKWDLKGSNVWDIFPQLKVIKGKSNHSNEIRYARCKCSFYRDGTTRNKPKHMWKRCNIL